MKVVITGANGQLGYSLQRVAPAGVEVIALDRTQFDLSAPDSLGQCLRDIKPAAVINAAAYTAVDRAESDAELAFVVNAQAPLMIAQYCQTEAIPLIQVSTDFVFDGAVGRPYSPASETSPLGVYGQSKLQGEANVLDACDSAYVVRTGWVYCEHGANFVKTMLRLGRERDALSVVADQIGTPTYAGNLAAMIWQLLEQRPENRIYHFSDAGVASWYDFAVAIFSEAAAIGLLVRAPKVTPIKAVDYPTPAARPAYSVLDKSQTWSELGVDAIHWRDALTVMLGAYSKLSQ